MPRCGTTNAIFTLRQLQDKYLANLYFAFVDLAKAFDRVPKGCFMMGFEETRCRRVAV